MIAYRRSVLIWLRQTTGTAVRALARRPLDRVALFLRELHREHWEEVRGELMVFVEDQWRLMEEAPGLSEFTVDEEELEALLEDCSSEKGRSVW